MLVKFGVGVVQGVGVPVNVSWLPLPRIIMSLLPLATTLSWLPFPRVIYIVGTQKY